MAFSERRKRQEGVKMHSGESRGFRGGPPWLVARPSVFSAELDGIVRTPLARHRVTKSQEMSEHVEQRMVCEAVS
jgi:hypothetical protein